MVNCVNAFRSVLTREEYLLMKKKERLVASQEQRALVRQHKSNPKKGSMYGFGVLGMDSITPKD